MGTQQRGTSMLTMLDNCAMQQNYDSDYFLSYSGADKTLHKLSLKKKKAKQ